MIPLTSKEILALIDVLDDVRVETSEIESVRTKLEMELNSPWRKFLDETLYKRSD